MAPSGAIFITAAKRRSARSLEAPQLAFELGRHPGQLIDAGLRFRDRRVIAVSHLHDLFDPLRDGAAEAVEPWLAGAGQVVQSAGRYEFTLASDDPEDLTLRQARLRWS